MQLTRWRWALSVLFATMVVAGCTTGEENTTTTTTGQTATTAPSTAVETTTTTEPPVDELLVWADETHAPLIESAAEAFTADTGLAVRVEVKGFSALPDEVIQAAPTGQGPDIFVGTHLRTGELAEADVVTPLDLTGRSDLFLDVTLDAFLYGGEPFGVPYAAEAVALFYNTDLVAQPPTDFASLQAACESLGYPTSDGLPCLAIPAGDPYHQYPFLSAFGGYIFGFTDDGFDLSDVGLDSTGAAAGAEFLDSLYRSGLADGAVGYGQMADFFNQGSVPFMWTGSWQLGSVEAAGVNYAVASLPLMDGNTPQPFAEVRGYFVSSYSQIQDLSLSFLLDYVATTDVMVRLFEISGQPPALVSALEEVSADPNTESFGASVRNGVPLPNVPEMDIAWPGLVDAIAVINNGTYGEEYVSASGETLVAAGDAAGVIAQAAEQVRAALGTG